MAGIYELTFDDSFGTPADCVTLGVSDPTDPLRLTQTGAGLQGTLGGVLLSGSLYDTSDLSISGMAPTVAGVLGAARLHAHFSQGFADGGSTLSGHFSGLYHLDQGSAAIDCALERTVTGIRR